jgi:hypothetical protein
MGVVAPLLGIALALAAPRSETAFALLSDNRLVEIAVPTGKVLARRTLGAKPQGYVGAGRMLAVDGTRLFVLIQAGSGTDSIGVVEAETAEVHARWPLEVGVRYRGIVLAGDTLIAYGGREGREVDTTDHIREQSALVTELDLSTGKLLRTATIRPAEGHMWWIYWAAVSNDGNRLAVSYHGGCGVGSPDLCTTGADILDVRAGFLNRCPRDDAGCVDEAHGMVVPYRDGWVAATGGRELLVLDDAGGVMRKLDTRLRSHLMDFALDGDAVLVAHSCDGPVKELRRVSLGTGKSSLVRRKVCGEQLVAARRALIVIRHISGRLGTAGHGAIDLRRRSDGRLLRTIRVSVPVLDVAVRPNG